MQDDPAGYFLTKVIASLQSARGCENMVTFM